MSVQLTPAKRQNETEVNGREKWQKNGRFSSPGSSVNGGILRLLCPAKKIGGVIGKGGFIITQIRQETGVKIRVEEPVPGCNDRVITLTASDKDDGKVTEQSNKEGDEETDETEPGKNEQNEENVDKRDSDSGDAVAEGGEKKRDITAVQKALFLVFERMVDGESGKDGEGVEESDNKGSSFAVRVLVFSNQIGCLLGQAGCVIKKMIADSGAQIRIVPRDKLPLSASASDEVVQISGALDAVRKALSSVSQQLLEYPVRDQRFLSGHPSGPSPHSGGRSARPEALAQPNHAFHGQGPPSGFRDGEAGFPQDLLTYRLWCPHDKIGGVIGKGGAVVRSIQFETGCEIKVLDYPADSEDRIIVISGPAHPDERVSAPQDALFRVQSKIFRASPEEKNVLAKLLVSSYQIGCLLGKGGSIMAEMRKSSGAYIRILAKDQNPQGALENDELVQVSGEFDLVLEALVQITSRLREHFFRDAFPSVNYPSNPAFHDQGPPYSHFMGRGDHSPSGRYPDLGPPFHKFDSAGGLPSPGGFHPHDERPPFKHNFNRPAFPPHISERFPSSAPWGPQGPIEGGVAMGPDFMGGPPRGIAGFGGGNHGAIITSTTVEVVVPRNVVPAIYGEGGGCLRQIREISDAKITITDTKPGVPETVIIISGTPEQTNAAQSLIQAFVIIETEGNGSV